LAFLTLSSGIKRDRELPGFLFNQLKILGVAGWLGVKNGELDISMMGLYNMGNAKISV
jgi:hypothetical protein